MANYSKNCGISHNEFLVDLCSNVDKFLSIANKKSLSMPKKNENATKLIHQANANWKITAKKIKKKWDSSMAIKLNYSEEEPTYTRELTEHQARSNCIRYKDCQDQEFQDKWILIIDTLIKIMNTMKLDSKVMSNFALKWQSARTVIYDIWDVGKKHNFIYDDNSLPVRQAISHSSLVRSATTSQSATRRDADGVYDGIRHASPRERRRDRRSPRFDQTRPHSADVTQHQPPVLQHNFVTQGYPSLTPRNVNENGLSTKGTEIKLPMRAFAPTPQPRGKVETHTFPEQKSESHLSPVRVKKHDEDHFISGLFDKPHSSSRAMSHKPENEYNEMQNGETKTYQLQSVMNLKSKCNALENDNCRLKEEIHTISANSKEWYGKYKECERQLIAANAENEDLKVKHAYLVSVSENSGGTIAEKVKEISTLRQELSNMKYAITKKNKQLEKLTQERNSAQQDQARAVFERDTLEERLSTKPREEYAGQVRSLEDKLQKSSEEYHRLKNKAQRTIDERNKSIVSLEHELETLKQDSKRRFDDIEHYKSERKMHVQKLEMVDAEKERLTAKMRKRDGEIKTLENDINDMRRNFQPLVEKQDEAAREITQKDARIKTLEQELVVAKRKSSHSDKDRTKEDMEMLHQQLEKMKQEKAYLTHQLSASMNREIGRDESSLENINVRNRPMKISEDFGVFCSQQWLDAKNAVDESAESANRHKPLPEKERCELLCSVLMRSYEIARQAFKGLKGDISEKLLQYANDPFAYLPTEARIDRSRGRGDSRDLKLDKDFEVSLSKALKEPSDKVDFTSYAQGLVKDVFADTIKKEKLDRGLLKSKDLLDYAKGALSLSWRMILQQPPMTYDCDSLLDQRMPDEKAEPHFGSDDPKDPSCIVHYYVYPALYHGLSQMRKARVCLIKSTRRSSVRDDTALTDIRRAEKGMHRSKRPSSTSRVRPRDK